MAICYADLCPTLLFEVRTVSFQCILGKMRSTYCVKRGNMPYCLHWVLPPPHHMLQSGMPCYGCS
jgi:hypothetical protein